MTTVFRFNAPTFVKEMKTAAAGLLFFGAFVMVAHGCSGCSQPAKAAEIEAAYTAELIHCSAVAATKAEAKLCRDGVNKRYGLCEQAQWPNITPCD